MKSSLILIESPNKIKTIQKYLNSSDSEVMATVGHFRELDEHKYDGLGFNPNTYEIIWRNDSKKKINGATVDIVQEINKKANQFKNIYLSTDPDREGEAISWHIYSILDEKNKHKCKRVCFNEITKSAINLAFKNPRDLDQNQVNSYLARKLLDRGLGFKLSRFVQGIVSGTSAGRVQSIALKFLKDRDSEIKAFIPEHWFNLKAILKNNLEIVLKNVADPSKYKFHETLKNSLVNFLDEKEAEDFKNSLSQEFELISISDPKFDSTHPNKALKTSTMQRAAINLFGFSSATVERLAQKLYEGVEVDGESIALITYPRTDREDLSETFINSAKNFVVNRYGEKYWFGAKKDKNTSPLVQGAHEAIRPTNIELLPSDLVGKLQGGSEIETSQLLKLYKLIWTYSVSSLMSNAEYQTVVYSFQNEKNLFTANHKIETFDGFKLVLRNNNLDALEESKFPKNLKIGNKYKIGSLSIKKVDKSPPPLYTESSLIKALEEKGIGRPSTYSHIVNIVVKRLYAVRDSKKLVITDLGLKMAELLEKYFPVFMEYDYTKNMELSLDNISHAILDWKKFLDEFFAVFNKELLDAVKSYCGTCELCGAHLVSRFSKKTKRCFFGCSNFPTCKYIDKTSDSSSNKSEALDEKCPDCGKDLVKRKNKWGKEFVGCSNFPTCKYIDKTSDSSSNKSEALDEKCPDCGKDLVKRKNKKGRDFVGCSNYPDCKYIARSNKNQELLNKKCLTCGKDLVKRTSKKGTTYIRCSDFKCKYVPDNKKN